MCSQREYFARRRFQTILQCDAWAAFIPGVDARGRVSGRRRGDSRAKPSSFQSLTAGRLFGVPEKSISCRMS